MPPLNVESLCSILGIHHPLDRSTCIGYGKAKPTCGNAVAAASRNAAVIDLKGVCSALEQGRSNTRLMDKLDKAAHLLHCKRNHQYQAGPMADEWFILLTNYMAGQRERAERRRQQQEEELRSEHHRASNRSTEAVPAETSARHRRSPALASSQHSHSSIASIASTTPSLSAEVSSDSSRRTHSLPSSTSESASSHIHTPSMSASSSPQRATSSLSNPSTTSKSDSECGVCLSDLPRGDSDVWRCTTCRNATHVECFGAWMASSRSRSVRCIYCRTEVET